VPSDWLGRTEAARFQSPLVTGPTLQTRAFESSAVACRSLRATSTIQEKRCRSALGSAA